MTKVTYLCTRGGWGRRSSAASCQAEAEAVAAVVVSLWGYCCFSVVLVTRCLRVKWWFSCGVVVVVTVARRGSARVVHPVYSAPHLQERYSH